eukprot:scaffold48820_cov17-Tisochrysis_lutea.AAC.1
MLLLMPERETSTALRPILFAGGRGLGSAVENAMLMPVVLQDIAHPGTDHPSGSEPGAGAAEGGGRPGSVEATTPGAAHKRGKPREESHA